MAVSAAPWTLQASREGMALLMKMIPFELGLASYTFRAFGVDEAIAMTRRLGLKRIAFKSIHLPLDAPDESIRATVAKATSAGLDLYGGGVIYMTNEAEVRRAFAYARTAGMRMIIGVPQPELLGLAERLVKNSGLRLAIHNHGPADKVYPTPESVYERIERLDPRIGLCLDVGHTQRSGIDPSVPARRFSDRLLDIHIKDVSAPTEKGETVEIGRGVIDIPNFLRTLVKVHYSGSVSLEYEKDEKDPLPGAAESIGYLRGVLASL
jgi:inosose dehydratase